MQVHIEMPVDVVQRQSCRVKSFKLRADLLAQLGAAFRRKKILKSRRDRILRELSLWISQVWKSLRWEGGPAANQRQVETDAEAGLLPRHLDGLPGRRFIDHQARGGENSVLVGANDRFVDGFRASKIIGVDDQAALWGAIAHSAVKLLSVHLSTVKIQFGFERRRQSASLDG